MRLLNTKSLRVEEFVDDPQRPAYAILSHTWGEEEVTLQDIEDLDRAKGKVGFSKVRDAATRAKSDGYQYIWIDTCCIDKTSSAELSEAINSMYRWYKESNVCYVFLADVDVKEGWKNFSAWMHLFRRSRWFTRGWTLQELIASQVVQFYSRTWSFLAEKDDLLEVLYSITGIDHYILKGGDPTYVSVARRMYWASRRQTTRPEDESYCLLGLFNIHMPLLYGEGGRKAFLRLQEEILKISDDQSIFSWLPTSSPDHTFCGRPVTTSKSLLAKCPGSFSHCGEIGLFPYRRTRRNFAVMTGEGMKMNFIVASNPPPTDSAFLILDCPIGPWPGTSPAIGLVKMRTPHEVAGFCEGVGHVRFASHGADADYEGLDPVLLSCPGGQHRQAVFLDKDFYEISRYSHITQEFVPLTLPANPGQESIWNCRLIWVQPSSEISVEFSSAYPSRNWDPKTRLLLPQPEEHLRLIRWFGLHTLIVALEFKAVELEVSFNVLIGCVTMAFSTISTDPWCLLLSNGKDTRSAKEVYENHEFTGPEDVASTSTCPILGLTATVRICKVSGSEQLFLSIARQINVK